MVKTGKPSLQNQGARHYASDSSRCWQGSQVVLPQRSESLRVCAFGWFQRSRCVGPLLEDDIFRDLLRGVKRRAAHLSSPIIWSLICCCSLILLALPLMFMGTPLPLPIIVTVRAASAHTTHTHTQTHTNTENGGIGSEEEGGAGRSDRHRSGCCSG
jgi:hypothetical protein